MTKNKLFRLWIKRGASKEANFAKLCEASREAPTNAKNDTVDDTDDADDVYVDSADAEEEKSKPSSFHLFDLGVIVQTHRDGSDFSDISEDRVGGGRGGGEASQGHGNVLASLRHGVKVVAAGTIGSHQRQDLIRIKS